MPYLGTPFLKRGVRSILSSKKVLVPVDPDPCIHVAQMGSVFSFCRPDNIIFLHILHTFQKTQDKLISPLFRAYNAQATAQGIAYTNMIEQGKPDSVIVRVAEREAVDLILLASRGHDTPSMERILQTSNAMLYIVA